LKPNGVFVPADPLKALTAFAANPFRRKKTKYLLVDRGRTGLLTELAGKVSDGSLKAGPYTEVDFEDFAAAFAALKDPGRPGRTVFRLR